MQTAMFGAANPSRHIPGATDEQIVRAALTIMEERMRYGREVLASPDALRTFLRLRMAHLEHEVFGCAFLNSQLRLIEYTELFRGTLTEANVYPREVVKEALRHNAASVVLAHNHPSGITEPSAADRMLTATLADALRLVDVRVLDHMIVGGTSILSFVERGIL